MSVIDKICGKIGLVDSEEERKLAEEEARLDDLERQEAEEREAAKRHMQENKEHHNVVNFHPSQNSNNSKENVVTNYKMKVVVIEPKNFDDSPLVANNLRERKPVVINFEHTDPADVNRIIDFAMGTTYALDGDIKKVGHNVYLCAPSNVNVSYTEKEKKFASDLDWQKKED